MVVAIAMKEMMRMVMFRISPQDPVAPSVDPAKEFGGLGQHCEPALLRWHEHNLCDDRFGLLLLIICNDAMLIVEVS